MHEASYLRHRRRRVTFSEERRGKTAATFDYRLLLILRELTKRKLLISLTVKGLEKAEKPSNTMNVLDDPRLHWRHFVSNEAKALREVAKIASRRYKNAGRSRSPPKETILKVDALRCCELFRIRFLAPLPRTFGSYYEEPKVKGCMLSSSSN
ncbi:hypothetical protein TNCV_4386661 [Trichonephila clavipes]|nr:hypothetical protein TNCV_4386661 [Trichonephila clavipes]